MISNNKRIAKNTLFLYFRMLLIMGVSLYTVRVVLDTLGVVDYGIYNVVAGVVTFFSFLSGTMASATQRFFSFAIGKEDSESLKKIFSVNLLIYATIAIVALILLGTIGSWFIHEQLKIPAERVEAAITVFYFAVFTFVLTIFTSPFIAIIIAHEDMKIYAYVSVLEAIMKLGVVYLLIFVSWDKLELYGILLFFVAIINMLIYLSICTMKYKECQFRRFYWDKKLMHEIVGFTGWTLFGQLTTVVRNQAVTILLNQMFTPVVVAARAIANNVTSQVNIFSSNFNTSLYPPIIKSYAANNKQEMFSLLFFGSKATFFLMWILALPLFLEMEAVLTLWLKTPPPEAVLFTRLALVEALINSVSLPLTTAARAPGKMKVYELTLGSIQIAIFFIAWFVLLLGGEAYTVFVVAIVANLIMFIIRVVIVRNLIGLPLNLFFKQVVFPLLSVTVLSSFFSLFVRIYRADGITFSIITGLISMLLSIGCMYFIGINQTEREKINTLILKRLKK